MDIWLEMIRENNLFKMAHSAGPDEIASAEKKLGITFADDYKLFLSSIGACICFGHEIKGITDNANLNVVSATEEARISIEMMPHSWYVIEDTHMDGILILQDKNGSIYQMAPGKMPKKIAYGLETFITEPSGNAGSRSLNDMPECSETGKETSIEDKAQEVLNKNYEEAKKKLENPDLVEKILQQMEKKLEKIPGVGDWLADVPAVISLVRSYIRKEYSDVPVGSIIAAVAAILYVVSPIDLIPDFIPGVGMLDDAAVFVACWKMIHDDVDKYQEWRKKTGKEIV